jgi:hypothetical protein
MYEESRSKILEVQVWDGKKEGVNPLTGKTRLGCRDWFSGWLSDRDREGWGVVCDGIGMD